MQETPVAGPEPTGAERTAVQGGAPLEKWLRLLVICATLLLVTGLAAVTVRIALWFEHTLVLFALGALVAYALVPLVDGLSRLRRRNDRPLLSREACILTVFAALIAVIGIGIWALGGNLANQVSSMQRDYPRYSQQAMTLAGKFDHALHARGIHFSLANSLRHPPPEVKSFAEEQGKRLLPMVGQLLVNLGEAALVLLIALYFLLYAREMRANFNLLLPQRLQPHAELWEADSNYILGGFMRGQIVIALITGAVAAVGCLAIGIRPWLIVGILVAVTSLVPVFGPVIGAAPAVVAAMVGPTHIHNPVLAAVVVIVFFVVLNEAASKILYPRLVGSALGLNTVIVLFVLLAGLELAGVIGVLLSAPLTALVYVSAVHFYRFWQELPDGPLIQPPSVAGRTDAQPRRPASNRRRQRSGVSGY